MINVKMQQEYFVYFVYFVFQLLFFLTHKKNKEEEWKRSSSIL